MKTIVISDLHGRGIWQYILAKEPDFTRVIFIGDYFDSWDIPFGDQMSNFKHLIEYKEKSDKEVIMLIGNHDFHYTNYPLSIGENYSGFQGDKAGFINEILESNSKHLQLSYSFDKFLFTHAGVSKTFLNRVGINNDEDLSKNLNELYFHKPKEFLFNGRENHGDDITQGPLWIRPRSLMRDSKELGLIQVVGHTRQNCIDIQGKSTGGKYYFIDVLDSSEEYLIITDDSIYTGDV